MNDKATELASILTGELRETFLIGGKSTGDTSNPDRLYQDSASHESGHRPQQHQRISAAEAFQESFIYALSLKARLILGDKHYHLVYFRPGNPFDPETMNRDGWTYDGYTKKAGLSTSQGPGNGLTVKLCLFPALYSYPIMEKTDHCIPDFGFERCTVSYDIFKPGEPLYESGRPRLVVKAVVLI